MKPYFFINLSIILLAACSRGKNTKNITGDSNPVLSNLAPADIETDFAECRQILTLDMIQQMSDPAYKKETKNYLTRDLFTLNFNTLSAEAAWERYLEVVEIKKERFKDSDLLLVAPFVSGIYSNIILEKTQFIDIFEREKKRFTSKFSAQFYDNTVANYLTYIGENETTASWRQCVLKPKSENRLSCFAYRVDANKVFLEVLRTGGITEKFEIANESDNGFLAKFTGKTPNDDVEISCNAVVPPTLKQMPNRCDMQHDIMYQSGNIDVDEYMQFKKTKSVVTGSEKIRKELLSCDNYLNYY